METLLNKNGKSFDAFLKSQIMTAHERIATSGGNENIWFKGYLNAMEKCSEFFGRHFKLVLVQEEVKEKNE